MGGRCVDDVGVDDFKYEGAHEMDGCMRVLSHLVSHVGIFVRQIVDVV